LSERKVVTCVEHTVSSDIRSVECDVFRVDMKDGFFQLGNGGTGSIPCHQGWLGSKSLTDFGLAESAALS
jgi:hypothetical protein